MKVRQPSWTLFVLCFCPLYEVEPSSWHLWTLRQKWKWITSHTSDGLPGRRGQMEQLHAWAPAPLGILLPQWHLLEQETSATSIIHFSSVAEPSIYQPINYYISSANWCNHRLLAPLGPNPFIYFHRCSHLSAARQAWHEWLLLLVQEHSWKTLMHVTIVILNHRHCSVLY